MQPRIYTYKITFKEIPHWYWGVHKEKRYNDGYMGSPVTHKWMWEFYTPKMQILEVFPFTDEGWKEAQAVEKRLIAPDLNNPLCLNEGLGPTVSLKGKSAGGKASYEMGVGVHDPEHKGAGAKKCRKEGLGFYDPEFQRQVQEIQKDRQIGIYSPDFMERMKENGMGVYSKGGRAKALERQQAEKSGLWDPEVRKRGKKKSEESQKKLKVGIHDPANKEKIIGAIVNQMWKSTIDGYRGRASSVALHNKANGWDPSARERVK
jgi:hypothetical protein